MGFCTPFCFPAGHQAGNQRQTSQWNVPTYCKDRPRARKEPQLSFPLMAFAGTSSTSSAASAALFPTVLTKLMSCSTVLKPSTCPQTQYCSTPSLSPSSLSASSSSSSSSSSPSSIPSCSSSCKPHTTHYCFTQLSSTLASTQAASTDLLLRAFAKNKVV